jgi:hypothetical protein
MLEKINKRGGRCKGDLRLELREIRHFLLHGRVLVLQGYLL